MHKRTFFYKNGNQIEEKALWENANDAKIDAEFHMKHTKSIHMISIKPIDGSAPINVVREEKKSA